MNPLYQLDVKGKAKRELKGATTLCIGVLIRHYDS